MNDIDEIRRNLKSDKVTARKKGKTDFEAIVMRDRCSIAGNNVQTMNIFYAIMEFELNEQANAKSKGKKIGTDISEFVRKAIKFCITNGQPMSSKLFPVLEHVLNIIQDDEILQNYKEEHRNILVDFCEPRLLHSIPFQFDNDQFAIKKLFVYLREAMDGKKKMLEPVNLKLLKGLCKSLVLDDCCNVEIIFKVLLNWFNTLLQKQDDDSSSGYILLLTTLAECCTAFMELSGFNFILVLYQHSELLLRCVCKHVCQFQLKDSQREALLRFLALFCQYSFDYLWDRGHVACKLNPLVRALSTVESTLNEETMLRNMYTGALHSVTIQKAVQQMQQQAPKELFVDVLSDSKLAVYFQVADRLLHLSSAIYYDQPPKIGGSARDALQKSASVSSMNDDDGQTQAAKRQRLTAPAPAIKEAPVRHYGYGAFLVRLVQLGEGALTASQSITGARTQITGQPPSSSIAAKQNLAVMESNLALLAYLCQTHGDGEFLLMCKNIANIHPQKQLELKFRAITELVRALLHRLTAVADGSDSQLIGSLVQALAGLSGVTGQLLRCNVAHCAAARQWKESCLAQWSQVLVFLLHSKALQRFCSQYRRHSIGEVSLSLINAIVEANLVNEAFLSKHGEMLYQLRPLAVPAPLEGAVLMQLLCCLKGVCPLHGIQRLMDVMRECDPVAAQSMQDALDSGKHQLVPNVRAAPQLDAEDGLFAAMFAVSCLLQGLRAAGDGNIEVAMTGPFAGTAGNSTASRLAVTELASCSDALASIVWLAVCSDSMCAVLQRRAKESSMLRSVGKVTDFAVNKMHWLDPPLSGIHCDEDLFMEFSSKPTAPAIESAFCVDEAVLAKTCLLLDAVLQRVLAAKDVIGFFTEPIDQFTSWQLVAVQLMSGYAALAEAIGLLRQEDQHVSVAMEAHFSHCVESLLILLQLLVKYLQTKFSSLKSSHIAAYLAAVARIVCRMSGCLQHLADVDLQRLRYQAVEGLVALLRAIQKETFNSTAQIDADFDRGYPAATQSEKGGKGKGKSAQEQFDDDSDFDGFTASARKTQTKITKYTGGGSGDGFDSDMDVEVAGGKSSSLELRQQSNRVRSIFSVDQLSSFIAAAQCCVILSAKAASVAVKRNAVARADTPLQSVNLVEILSSVKRDDGEATKVITGAEVYLVLAQHLSVLDPPYPSIDQFIGRCAWHIEWGCLGYCKVLQIIYETTRLASFWSSELLVNTMLPGLVKLIIPQNDELLESFPVSLWFARVMQLECLGCLLRHDPAVSARKEEIRDIFLHCIRDPDLRVRNCVISKLTLLLRQFKNVEKVYGAILQTLGVAVFYQERMEILTQRNTGSSQASSNRMSQEDGGLETVMRPTEVPLLIYSAAIAMARMGCFEPKQQSSNPFPLAQRAVVDLIILCCSRKKVQQSITAVNVVMSELQLCSYEDLLTRLVEFMAQRIGYPCTALFVRDHLRWILHQWIVVENNPDLIQSGDQSAALSSQSAGNVMGLSDFPFKLLYPFQNITLRQFLQEHSSLIVPTICQIDQSQRRWRVLVQLTTDLGMAGSDRDLAKVVKENLCAIKAWEFTAHYSGMVLGQQVQQSEDVVIAKNNALFAAKTVQEFVTRVLNANDAAHFLHGNIHGIVEEFCTLQTMESVHPFELKARPDYERLQEAMCMAALGKMKEMVRVESIDKLLQKCNLVEIFAGLRARLLESSRSSCCVAVLITVKVVLLHTSMSDWAVKAVVSMAMLLLHDACNRCPCQIKLILSCWNRIVQLLVSAQYCESPTLGTAEIGTTDRRAELFGECVVELGALWQALQVVLRRQTSNVDEFLRHRYDGFLAQGRTVERAELEDAEAAMQTIIGELFIKLNANPLLKLERYLPLPEEYQFKQCNQAAVAEFLQRSQEQAAVSVKQRMQLFVEKALAMMHGELTPLSCLWTQLVVLRSELFAGEKNLKPGFVAVFSHWSAEPQLTASFASALLGICQLKRAYIPDGALSGIKQLALSLLGHLGPPDVLTVQHKDFPLQLEDLMMLTHYSISSAKVHLLQKIVLLLWGTPEEYRQSSSILRVLCQSNALVEEMRGCLAVAPILSVQETLQFYAVNMLPKHVACEDGVQAAVGDALWSTEGGIYEQWVTRLVHGLAREYYDSSTCTTAAAAAAAAAGGVNVVPAMSQLSQRSQDGTIKGSSLLVAGSKALCLKHADFAETLLPLLVYDLLKLNGLNSLLYDTFSTKFATCLLSPTCKMKEATILACKVLTFLLRQDIKEYTVEQRNVSADSSSSPRLETSKVANEGWKLPYGYHLNIAFCYAAEAAARCNLTCTALLFAELSDESERGAVVNSQKSLMHEDAKLSRVALSKTLNRLLTPIYQGIHDPDALYGLNISSSLQLQALMYTHKGSWMEALTTHECLLQQSANCCDTSVVGVALALKGLGAQRTLAAFAESREAGSDVRRIADDAIWRDGRQAAKALSCWDMPASAASAQSNELFNSSVASILRDIENLDAVAALKKLQDSSVQVFGSILDKMSDETAQFVIEDLARAQQLTELSEVCQMIQDAGSNRLRRNDGLLSLSDRLLRRWSSRIINSNVSGESQVALRVIVVEKLLKLQHLTPVQAVESMNQFLQFVRSRETAHTISPLMYRCWHSIQQHMRGSGEASRLQAKLIDANWSLHECKLMWKKGLKDAAISGINDRVISTLREVQALSNAAADPARKSAAAAMNPPTANRGKVILDLMTVNLLSEALRTGGEWTSTKRAATGTEILEEYFLPSVNCVSSAHEKIRSYETIALFHERLFLSVKAKISSVEWQQGARVLNDRKREFEECRAIQIAEKQKRDPKDTSVPAQMKALYKHTQLLKKEIDLDTKERQGIEESAEKYLLAAIHDYMRVLQLSTEGNLDTMFRLVNLWLSNGDNENVNNLMHENMLKISSHKFVPLAYQILSRLGRSPLDSSNGDDDSVGSLADSNLASRGSVLKDSEKFQSVLSKLVFRLCFEHPHHTLPQLFALAHEGEMSGSFDGATQFKSKISKSRFDAATSIINQLKASELVSKTVTSMETMLLHYISLANTGTEQFHKNGRNKDIKFRELQPRGKRFNESLAGFEEMPAVITISHALSPLKDYKDLVRVQEFAPTFSITDNGISRPKIISCQGSDGKMYKQLVKGGDDLRQDAVMQQVFDMVNYTLSRDAETQKRQLRLRTYKIVPTTPQTGILQWVEHTLPFGSILSDKETGVHKRYYPNDWQHVQCREYLKEAVDNRDKVKRYLDICIRFHPALRFFFLEKYRDPAQWLTSRLAYTRSVAANSIVGYILGIGDRHAHNILVDTNTAEVVHIDFGIVFEQGKGLGTPETVPFRLTRDLVDGMGVTGVEGTYRRSCEEVLRVLRDHTQQIMTILEVVIHDPLYRWSLSPLQARLKQTNAQLNEGNDEDLQELGAKFPSIRGGKNQLPQTVGSNTPGTATKHGTFEKDSAERTLKRVRDKLQGHEDPMGEALSIEGQVDMVINEARNPQNLCRLFPGWAPWL